MAKDVLVTLDPVPVFDEGHPPADVPVEPSLEEMLADVEAKGIAAAGAAVAAQIAAEDALAAQSDSQAKHQAFLDVRKAFEAKLDALTG